MLELLLGIFWSAWTVYLTAQAIRNQREARIGYFLSAVLTGLTAWVLLN